MFVHLDVMHLISNLLLLNFAGHMLFLQTSNSIFYRIYFLSGLAGVLALFVVDNILVTAGWSEAYSVGIGSSACVMGCLVCVTVLNPKVIQADILRIWLGLEWVGGMAIECGKDNIREAG